MKRTRLLPLATSLAAMGITACGSSGSSGGGGPGKVVERIDIVVDANRDGIANLDDDDSNGVRDADDDIVNSPADFWDFARIRVSGWENVAEGSRGVVRIDQEAAESIRIYKFAVGQPAELVLGSQGACDAPQTCSYSLEYQLSFEETRDGVEFGIEARRFRGQPLPSLEVPAGGDVQAKKNAWDGFVNLSYEVHGPDNALLTTDANPDGMDRAKMRVAPWLMLGSMGIHDRMYSSSASPVFVEGNTAAAQAAGVAYTPYSVSINNPGGWPDIWTEDFFQTGYTSFPGEDGVQHGMRIFNARPWGRPPMQNPTAEQRLEYAPITYIMGNPEKSRPPGFLGPDQGAAEFYDPEHRGYGHTQDSHGNHDLVPPFDGYPLGRIIHGNKTYAETAAFYDSQQVQGPGIVLDTTWLAVEHVDEFFHYVPANTARGWKLLVASPSLMTSMLEDLKAQGQGSAVLHVGKGSNFQKTVDQCLSSPDLTTWAQQSEVKIMGHVDTMKQETGLTDADIIYIPTWFEDLAQEEKVAWNVGMVNMRMLANTADIAKPFGPLINNVDPLEQYILDELGTAKNQLGSDGQGLKVHFTDDWYYHEALGEVHCGTNESAPTVTQLWWESGK